jgi:hypothetical protein
LRVQLSQLLCLTPLYQPQIKHLEKPTNGK